MTIKMFSCAFKILLYFLLWISLTEQRTPRENAKFEDDQEKLYKNDKRRGTENYSLALENAFTVVTFAKTETKLLGKRRVKRFQAPTGADIKSKAACESEDGLFDISSLVNNSDIDWAEQPKDYLIKSMRVDICKGLGKPCPNFPNPLPIGTSSECIQKYTKAHIEPKGSNKPVIIRIPTACVCQIKSNYMDKNKYIYL